MVEVAIALWAVFSMVLLFLVALELWFRRSEAPQEVIPDLVDDTEPGVPGVRRP